jgi:hypothetical protein
MTFGSDGFVRVATKEELMFVRVTAVVVIGLAAAARAQDGYTFTPIADTATTGFSGFSDVTMNQRGDVAFVGLSGVYPTGGAAVYVGRGDALVEIATSFRYADVHLGARAINDAGQVAFAVSHVTHTAFDSRVLVGSGGPLTRIAEEAGVSCVPFGTCGAIFYSAPSLTPVGRAVFYRETDLDTDQFRAIRTGTGGRVRTVVDTETEPLFFVNFTPDVNAANQVAYYALDLLDGNDGIFLADRNGARRMYDARGPQSLPFLQPTDPSLNAAGSIAFVERGEFGMPTRVLRGDGARVTTVAEIGDRFVGFGDRVSLNDLGQVAFSAFTDPTPQGGAIFVGDGDSIVRVVGVGDELLGRTVDNWGSQISLSDRGQLAFRVIFTDQSQAVIRADRP